MKTLPNPEIPVPSGPNLPNPEGDGTAFYKLDAAFSLARLTGIEHLVAGTGQQFITYEKGIPYPQGEHSGALQELLLDRAPAPEGQADEREWLALPDNYVTMSQALNDAIGNRSTVASLTLAHDLFAELGAALAQVAQSEGVLPQHLSHLQAIFLRDSAGVKWVPPLRMVKIDSAPEARERGLQQMWQSCARTAVTQVQMSQLEEAFKGFIELFTWS